MNPLTVGFRARWGWLGAWVALSPLERRLVLRALPVVIATRVAIRVVPFRRIVERVERVRVRDVSDAPPDAIALGVARASRVVPGATCLTRAIAAQVLLRRAGHPARLRIGVARDGGFAAHAWVEAPNGEALIGGNGDGYTILAEFA